MRKPLFALSLTVLLAACGGGGGTSGASGSASSSAPAVELTAAQRQAILATLPAPYNTADIEAGRRAFGACRSCHTVNAGGRNGVGPNLHGVFGRRAGTAEGYDYSDAVRNAGFNWDLDHLDHWLENPRTALPGNRMTFAGVADPERRRNLIAYLRVESSPPPAS